MPFDIQQMPYRSGMQPNDVPALSEDYPGLEVSTWIGFWLPARMPDEIVERLHAEIKAINASPEMQKFITEAGLNPVITTPAETAQIIAREAQAMSRLIKAKGIRLD